MIRIDYITDPLCFVFSMAVCSAADLTPTMLVTVLTLVPAGAPRTIGSAPGKRDVKPAVRARRRTGAAAQPSPA